MAELEQRLRMDAQQPSPNAASNIEVASEWVDHPRQVKTCTILSPSAAI